MRHYAARGFPPKERASQIYTIGLPNGRSCRLPTYVAAWKRLRTMKPDASVDGFGHFDQRADEILRELRRGMHDRINRHIAGYGVGRKWASDWWWPTWRLSRDVNTRRLVVRVRQCPKEFRARLAHRLSED